jgi:hypothetical protein
MLPCVNEHFLDTHPPERVGYKRGLDQLRPDPDDRRDLH